MSKQETPSIGAPVDSTRSLASAHVAKPTYVVGTIGWLDGAGLHGFEVDEAESPDWENAIDLDLGNGEQVEVHPVGTTDWIESQRERIATLEAENERASVRIRQLENSADQARQLAAQNVSLRSLVELLKG